jgi:putative membrane protein
MSDQPGDSNPRDHLANERTLLAWIRTALTLIGIGFLVDRLAAAQDQPNAWYAYAGVALVIVGAVLALVGAYTFMKTRRDLERGSFQPAQWLYLAVVALVVVGSIVLVAFLLAS